MWLPVPLITLGIPAGYCRCIRLLGRARRSIADGFAAASIELPGSGGRPRIPALDAARTELRRTIHAGEDVSVDIVDRLTLPLVDQGVPEWQALLDALLALPTTGGPVGYSGGVISISVRLAAVEPRIVATELFAGSFIRVPSSRRSPRSRLRCMSCCKGATRGTTGRRPLDLFDALGSIERCCTPIWVDTGRSARRRRRRGKILRPTSAVVRVGLAVRRNPPTLWARWRAGRREENRMRVRDAEVGDVSALVSLFRQVWPRAVTEDGVPRLAMAWATKLAETEQIWLVMESADQQVVAYARGRIRIRDPRMVDDRPADFEFEYLVVAEDHRGRGLGTRLEHAMCERIQGRCSTAVTDVQSTMPGALAFWLGSGWRQGPDEPNPGEGGTWRYVLTKDLTKPCTRTHVIPSPGIRAMETWPGQLGSAC